MDVVEWNQYNISFPECEDMSTRHMVETQVKSRGIKNPHVLNAIETVVRERFVPLDYRRFAYADCPLPIKEGQTISQPYMVAAMTEFLKADKNSRILEIGTGSGYQTAILAEIVKEVYTVEIIVNLGYAARDLLDGLGYENIYFKIGDGYFGWEQHGPYDGIIITAAPEEVPFHLAGQLVPGGVMVVPAGPLKGSQTLYVFHKDEDGTLQGSGVMDVRFVPLTRHES